MATCSPMPEFAPRSNERGWLLYGALLLVGGAAWTACRFFPADMPFWMPWEFSWPIFLVIGLALGWFALGLLRLPFPLRPAIWRRASFVLGTVATYLVLQTHVDYYAQHMFFVHRAQHFVLHHVGAFLIGLGAPGEAIWAGMPKFLKPAFASKPVRATVDLIQHPVVAPLLFVGLIYLWLIPDFHTRVMLDSNLYDVMNASMAIDGIFFWSLILDPRPCPPARLGFGVRALIVIAVEPLQMVLGAILSLSSKDYYPVYRICGRFWDIPALSDQHYGGLIIWLPSTLTSLAGMICVLVAMRLNEERLEKCVTP
ncbi:MAG TPA: cytochrome c oxidase assembly protein [Rhizomicrobium sp.]|nr:cytochrome c oxidase assembly protein [Rhizomicrobium sp.]